ncbi:MAG: cysteine--1-D-myo-inosityl 2-amino-2-deoxy-alpha-D-glucopyranoside ligase [Beutenbergiaceae bacterium]
MKSWNEPAMPQLRSHGPVPQVHDTATDSLVSVPGIEGQVGLYVCGITPYDSTHLGHAATYLAFDILVRSWRDAGLEVTYVQNVTDVDDPLLERADATGVPWEDLARSEIARFQGDMEALRIIPPTHYVGVVDSMELVVDAVSAMVRDGSAYIVGTDVYADLQADPLMGSISHLAAAEMDHLFAERGGDPQVDEKRHPRDPLLWRGKRDGEPAWPGGDLGEGRPGWHIECAAIAQQNLQIPITVQGGGRDLIYPHHEMSMAHLRQRAGVKQPASSYVHTGLVGYQGEKMSKSRGNLVFVSALRNDGIPAEVIRLTLLAQHYRTDWEYDSSLLFHAAQRFHRWQHAAQSATAIDEGPAMAELRAAVATDINTPAALAVVDRWAARPDRGTEIVPLISSLLGIELASVPTSA